MKKDRNHFLAAAAVTLLFSLVYEQFSHQVYSNCMVYAFTIPLLPGALLCMLLGRLPDERQPGILIRTIYHSGVATLTVGSLFRGVLEIYGTTSPLSAVYWLAGGGLCLIAAAAYLYAVMSRKVL